MDRTPQIENGFTRIANELLEAIMRQCRGPEAVFLAVIRQTYGFKKTSASISIDRMSKLTGISKKNINRAINAAKEKGYISILSSEGKLNPTYRINKNYKSWKSSSVMRVSSVVRKTILSSEEKILSSEEKILSSEDRTFKRKYKENIKKKHKEREMCCWPCDFCLTNDMKKHAIENGIDPKKVGAFFNEFKNWAMSKGAKYEDWEAAFRARVSKAQEYGRHFLKSKDGWEDV